MTVLEMLKDLQEHEGQTRYAHFVNWLSDYEEREVTSLTLPKLKFAWAEYEAVCWDASVDYPQGEFWYEGKWEPITRW